MYFVNQKKHKTSGTWDNNCHIKATLNEARHQFHAFMSTYAYGQDNTLDYVSASVEDENGLVIQNETDNRITEEE